MSEWIGILIILLIVVGCPAFLIIFSYHTFKGLKKRDQERIEAIIKETEDYDEVLGRIRVLNLPKFSPLGEMPLIHAVLVITANSMFVERIAEEALHDAVGGSIVADVYRYVKRRRKSEADKSFAIPKSKITKVWLKKFGWRGRGVKLKVITTEKEYEWIGNGLVLTDGWKKDVKLKDYENILLRAFPDRLSVEK